MIFQASICGFEWADSCVSTRHSACSELLRIVLSGEWIGIARIEHEMKNDQKPKQTPVRSFTCVFLSVVQMDKLSYVEPQTLCTS